MDRNSIIALVLIILVLLIWSIFFTPKRSPVTPKEEATAKPESVEVEQPPTPSPAIPVVDSFDTPTYRIVFTQKGGGISKIYLKHHLLPKSGGWVQLVPHGKVAFTEKVNLDGEIVNLGDSLYRLIDRTDSSVTFEFVIRGDTIRKTFCMDTIDYAIRLHYELPQPTKEYEVIVPGIEATEEWAMEYTYFSGVIRTLEGASTHPIRELARGGHSIEGKILWGVTKNKFFLIGLIPQSPSIGYSMWVTDLARTAGGCGGFGCMGGGYKGYIAFSLTLEPHTTDMLIYAGPMQYKVLTDLGLRDAYYLGWRWIRPISRALLVIFYVIHRVVPNYGLVIVIVSALIAFAFYPLNRHNQRAMVALQRLQPKIQELQKKYKDNPQKLNQAIMELYREHRVNPFSGCLPLLIQMPVFFALYAVFTTTPELRGARFLWVKNLVQPDPYFILPILMGVTLFIQQRFQPQTIEQQHGMTNIIFPILITFLFMNFPAGMALYLFTYNIVSLIQTILIRREELRKAQK